MLEDENDAADRVRRPAAARISSAPQLPGGHRPPFRRRARRGDRRVGRRGRSPRLYLDRARVHRAGPAARTIATPPASTPPSSWRCATPASATRSTATASSPPASSSAATWPGITPWPTPTCSPASVVISGLPAKYVPRYSAAPRAAAAVLRDRRAGPGGQRVHLSQSMSSR